MQNPSVKYTIGAVLLLIALVFVYRSFYGMRIPQAETGAEDNLVIGKGGMTAAEKLSY
jgi:K(+)-stimulated pyrophosphate-energized sodium pump